MERTARAIIFDGDKLLVFFRQKRRDGELVTYYAIPGGHVEGDETYETTVKRELKEEMNLDIEILGYLGKLLVDNREEHYYHAKIVGGELQFGGEELERNNEDNYYEIRWLEKNMLEDSGIKALNLVKKAIDLNYED